jgi:hypothetical protein
MGGEEEPDQGWGAHSTVMKPAAGPTHTTLYLQFDLLVQEISTQMTKYDPINDKTMNPPNN